MEQEIVTQIKNYLVQSEDFENYDEFVNSQSMGDCQVIVADIIRNFPQATKVFGEIEIDGEYVDEYGKIQTLVTHHWVKINGVQYDFSKGSLKGYVDFDSLEPEITPNELDKYKS